MHQSLLLVFSLRVVLVERVVLVRREVTCCGSCLLFVERKRKDTLIAIIVIYLLVFNTF